MADLPDNQIGEYTEYKDSRCIAAFVFKERFLRLPPESLHPVRLFAEEPGWDT